MKNHQRALGGLYQSVLRFELTHRYSVRWGPIVEGWAEIVDMPTQIMEAFSYGDFDRDAERLLEAVLSAVEAAGVGRGAESAVVTRTTSSPATTSPSASTAAVKR